MQLEELPEISCIARAKALERNDTPGTPKESSTQKAVPEILNPNENSYNNPRPLKPQRGFGTKPKVGPFPASRAYLGKPSERFPTSTRLRQSDSRKSGM